MIVKNTTEMVTAQDIQKAMKDSLTCDGLDQWLRDVLTVKFVQANAIKGTNKIRIDTREVKWGQNAFRNAMILRGFTVVHICDDRPCSLPQYEIGFQPTPQGGYRD